MTSSPLHSTRRTVTLTPMGTVLLELLDRSGKCSFRFLHMMMCARLGVRPSMAKTLRLLRELAADGHIHRFDGVPGGYWSKHAHEGWRPPISHPMMKGQRPDFTW